jgi:hypothetical protein
VNTRRPPHRVFTPRLDGQCRRTEREPRYYSA